MNFFQSCKDLLLQNKVAQELQSRCVSNYVVFEDSQVEQMYHEHRLKTIRANWRFILLILKVKFFLISVVFQLTTEDGLILKKLSPVMMFLLLFVFKYFIQKNDFVARYGAIFLILWFGFVMTCVNLQFPQFRLYEGFLFHISVSFLLSTCVVTDWRISSAAIMLVYCNLYILLKLKFDHVPALVLHVLLFSLTIFLFNAFLISQTFKQEFMATYTAKRASSQMKKVLQVLPEGVIIIDEQGEDLKFINKKLKQTFDVTEFYQDCKVTEELVKAKQMIDQLFDQICNRMDTGTSKAEDSRVLEDNILTNFIIKVKKEKIEEGKGADLDDIKEEYKYIPLASFLRDERELAKDIANNERSTKACICYKNAPICKEMEYLTRDFIVKTSKIEEANNRGNKPNFLQMFIDTTQITQLENEKAQSKYQRQMLSNVSHEFRTPLNAMSLSLHLMKPYINEDLEKFHRIANSSCDILKGLVEDILDFSKIEAGVFEIQESVFIFKQLFDEVNSIFEMQTKMKGIELEFKMEDVFQDLEIKSDKERLKQILLNLLSNSLKFTDRGSIDVSLKIQAMTEITDEQTNWNEEIQIIDSDTFEEMPVCNLLLATNNYNFKSNPSKLSEEVGSLQRSHKLSKRLQQEDSEGRRLSDFTKELKLELTVTDTGLGIPKKDLPSLFKLFGKTSSNHNRNKTGTGLGLTICKMLCEKLGGRIQLKSKPGIGTTVACIFTCFY
ncbi:unnamed protein product [Moneuplotes crassus]|uniref:histidine kinase n=1 Tax=Euplotes crassus TaxID=5936 RepID=A0AAD1Y7Z4_EUPCR|nr:unnamed protein product [Moneuplotes crassus]